MVRAESTFGARFASDSGNDVLNESLESIVGRILNTTPASNSVVVKGNSTVFRGESTAIEFTVRERGIDTSSTVGAAAAAGGCGSSGGTASSGRGRGRAGCGGGRSSRDRRRGDHCRARGRRSGR